MSGDLHKVHRQVDGLSLYYAGDLAIIMMDRGENRVNSMLVDAFNTLLDDVESNESCKGLITTGKGKFFSNGLDLDLIATLSESESLKVFRGTLLLLNRLIFLPIPTLAAINGHAFAAGALLAYAHDLRTMNSQRGWLCLNEVFINRQIGKFNRTFLEEKLGRGKNFTDSLVLGKRSTAQEALSTGLVHAIQPPRLLMQDSMRLMKSYYGKGYPRESLRTMKEDAYHATLACSKELVEQQRHDLEKSDSVTSKL